MSTIPYSIRNSSICIYLGIFTKSVLILTKPLYINITFYSDWTRSSVSFLYSLNLLQYNPVPSWLRVLCTGVNLSSNLIMWELMNETSIMIHRRKERRIGDRRQQKRVQLDVNTGSSESSFRTFSLNDLCLQFSCWFVHGVDCDMFCILRQQES
jgi:hypothetical protein